MNKLKIKRIKERYDTDRKRANAIKRAELKETAERNQNHVKKIMLTIEWKRSKTWGNNPVLTAHVEHIDGQFSRGVYTCSGCGYDKESTVIADCFNEFLLYRLWSMEKTRKEKPYGVRLPDKGYDPYFSGGIGVNCYTAIAKFIGGSFINVASGSTFDVYKYTGNK